MEDEQPSISYFLNVGNRSIHIVPYYFGYSVVVNLLFLDSLIFSRYDLVIEVYFGPLNFQVVQMCP